MNRWALVPVKSLQKSKSRLATVLSPRERANLTRNLLERTIAVLQETSAFAQVLVITRDEQAQQIGRQMRTLTFAESEGQGLNGALTEATAHATAAGAVQILILPADLPLVTAADVAQLLHFAEDSLVICSDTHQTGTNALLRPTICPFTYQYGENSFALHTAEARRRGLTIVPLQIPNIQFDLDTPYDWQTFCQLDALPRE